MSFGGEKLSDNDTLCHFIIKKSRPLTEKSGKYGKSYWKVP